jgi:hypothetical protein
MTTTKKILLLLALALGACRADSTGGVTIEHRLTPSALFPASGSACSWDPSAPAWLGAGTMDLATTLQYDIVFKVNNDLVDPSTTGTGTVSHAKTWHPYAARVRVNPATYVKDFNPSPALLSFSNENTTPADGGGINPSASGVVTVTAISSSLGQLIAGAAGGMPATIVLGITIQGRTEDHAYLETTELFYPVTVCTGCLPPPATCPTGQVAMFSCFGAGQELSAKCSAVQ